MKDSILLGQEAQDYFASNLEGNDKVPFALPEIAGIFRNRDTEKWVAFAHFGSEWYVEETDSFMEAAVYACYENTEDKDAAKPF